MSIHKTQAIVLNKYDFRETSLIVNFYTREFGKISGLLKGIRTDPKKFAGTLEVFSYNEIIFYRKRNSTLHLVSQADIIDNFTDIRANMLKVSAASILTELIDAVMPPEDANEDIFNLALGILEGLKTTGDVDKLGIIFKIKLLLLSGFKPHFDSCVCCSNKLGGDSKFSVTMGGLLCQCCFSRDLKARTIYKGTAATILYIEKNDFKTNLNLGLNPLIKKELYFVLNSFLDFHLGRRLKSERVNSSLKEVR